jgi:DNA/RNA-binding domain of Phe-tRNA-synthetase-like protein
MSVEATPPSDPPASSDLAASEPRLGWCAREVEQELPGLRLVVARARVERPIPSRGRTTSSIRKRLAELSNRYKGARAVNLRRDPIPAAYRVFFRHIGLDPDVTRTPLEAAVFERMLAGEFRSYGLLADILLIAMVDTGVPVWALDADTLDGPLGIRLSGESESLGRSEQAPALASERLVVADASTPMAVLFGELAPGHEPSAASRQLALFALQVPGVPSLHVEEALWTSASLLGKPQ